ncbi:hypothetical protein [Halobacterium wangiae]|uniref:hypothetical protein n=1 Tax=Halobacterium wangiae TaxID=2902623 RepID=UPI001E3A73B7|nr:hypothetical protein [Halobacterium wangiae]
MTSRDSELVFWVAGLIILVATGAVGVFYGALSGVATTFGNCTPAHNGGALVTGFHTLFVNDPEPALAEGFKIVMEGVAALGLIIISGTYFASRRKSGIRSRYARGGSNRNLGLYLLGFGMVFVGTAAALWVVANTSHPCIAGLL